MENNWYRFVVAINTVQHISIRFFMCHALQIVMIAFQQFHKVSGRSGLKPIVTEFHLKECIQQTERIVDAVRVFCKVITVIARFQFIAHFLIRHFLRGCQFVQIFFKIKVYLLFGDSTDGNERLVHGDIIQIVQVTEHAYFAKLGHSRQQGKLDAAVHGFQYAIERFQSVAEFALQFLVADSLEQGFVIFVDENGYTLTTLLIGSFHNSCKAQGKGTLSNTGSIKLFPL